jgi:inosine-uridine nucleoside N-ribohydrolase
MRYNTHLQKGVCDMAIPLLVDTDAAFDDWLALAYLIHCPEIDLKAVTLAATGEAHAGAGVDTMLRILQLNNLTVPVTSGRTQPLRGNHAFPLPVRLAMDFRLGVQLPKSQRQAWKGSSKALLIQQLESAPEPVRILSLGPLTNIADLLIERPGLRHKIEMLYVMGGALQVSGNLTELLNTRNTYAEWNMYVDYYAADVVFRSGVDITLIPLDLTNQFPVTDSFFSHLIAEIRTPAAHFMMRVLKRLKTLSGKRTIYIWDLVAAVIATHPEQAGFERRQLCVLQDNGFTMGRVVEDVQGSWMRVCTYFDPPMLQAIVLNTLNQYSVEQVVPVETVRPI